MDGFYRSDDQADSIKALNEASSLVREKLLAFTNPLASFIGYCLQLVHALHLTWMLS